MHDWFGRLVEIKLKLLIGFQTILSWDLNIKNIKKITK